MTAQQSQNSPIAVMPSARSAQPAWRKLAEHQGALSRLHLRDLTREPGRFERLSLGLEGMLVDFSKQRVNAETMRLLADLARECRFESWRDRMLAGEPVNVTEGRAALHVALRGGTAARVEGKDVSREIAAQLADMARFVRGIGANRVRGATRRPFTDVVNLGIGGSDLGPRLACDALDARDHGGLRPHFVSNVDGTAISKVLAGLEPASTLVVVASKTFSTQETLANARTALAWLKRSLGGKAAAHLCAVTANTARALEFGVPRDQVFGFWEWVGGRYSLWSAVGLPFALAVGMRRFDELRDGARAMDEHFATAPLEKNLPVLMGLLEVWNVNFLGCGHRAVLPYDERLRLLPAYLQQLEMESSGKSVTRDGDRVGYATAPITWGSVGTDAQHAYFQWLHQGTAPVAADFIACCRPPHRLREQHAMLLSNFFAQTEALAHGMTAEEVAATLRKQGAAEPEIARLAPHRTFDGNRPSTSILLDELTPRALGGLIALYEHKVFVQSVIWDINPFDQWGVELGKTLAGRILPELDAAGAVSSHDASTNGLINHFKTRRRKK